MGPAAVQVPLEVPFDVGPAAMQMPLEVPCDMGPAAVQVPLEVPYDVGPAAMQVPLGVPCDMGPAAVQVPLEVPCDMGPAAVQMPLEVPCELSYLGPAAVCRCLWMRPMTSGGHTAMGSSPCMTSRSPSPPAATRLTQPPHPPTVGTQPSCSRVQQPGLPTIPASSLAGKKGRGVAVGQTGAKCTAQCCTGVWA